MDNYGLDEFTGLPPSVADTLHIPNKEQAPQPTSECPDWLPQGQHINLLHGYSQVPLMDQLWPELAAGNCEGQSQAQPPAPLSLGPPLEEFPQSALPPSINSQETISGEKKGKRRIPFSAKKILDDSFARHADHPYVPPDELQELVVLTGLTIRQVRTYFSNARARKLPPLAYSGTSKAQNTDGVPSDNDLPSDPLARYLSSSSEQEDVDEEIVHEAAKKLRLPPRERRRRMSISDARSSSSSAGSVDSSHGQSYDSIHRRGSRRGRRRWQDPGRKQITSVARKPSSPSRRFQCTFCTVDFTQKYDWRRHEESIHAPQKEWVCMPDGPVDGSSHCVLCNHHNPDKRHLDSHKSITCSDAPHAQRAFQRKDKLIQHIKQVHACGPPKMMNKWCRPINHDVSLVCGLCMKLLPDWGTRADHMVSHFNDGVCMDAWLLERPGGVVTPDLLPRADVLRSMASYYSHVPHPNGTHVCEVCSSTFRHMSNLILHRRQVHNIFHSSDMAKEYWPNATNFGQANASASPSPSTSLNMGQIQEEEQVHEEIKNTLITNTLQSSINPISTIHSQPYDRPIPHPTNPALNLTPPSANAYPRNHGNLYRAAPSSTQPPPPSPLPPPTLDSSLRTTHQERERFNRRRESGGVSGHPTVGDMLQGWRMEGGKGGDGWEGV